MPSVSVIAMFRTSPVRSSRRIAQTANWQVNELRMRTSVRPNAKNGSAWRLYASVSAGSPGTIGGQTGAAARTVK
jgi:hypothetical protein